MNWNKQNDDAGFEYAGAIKPRYEVCDVEKSTEKKEKRNGKRRREQT